MPVMRRVKRTLRANAVLWKRSPMPIRRSGWVGRAVGSAVHQVGEPTGRQEG